MKKFLFLVATVLLCTTTQAQIVTSSSVIVIPPKTDNFWFVRGGLNAMTLSGGGFSVDSKMGYDITVGFQKSIGEAGSYWGMEAGLGSRGGKIDFGNDYRYRYDEETQQYSEYILGKRKADLMAHSIYISPFTYGWKHETDNAIKLDAHIGAYASYDYSGNATCTSAIGTSYEEEWDADLADWDHEVEGLTWRRFDTGLNVGFGIWYNRFNIDLTYQRGLIASYLSNNASDKCYTSNFKIRLGISF